MSTHNIPFSIQKMKTENHTLNYPKSTGYFSKGLKNEFGTAMGNELSVLEPLKVYYI